MFREDPLERLTFFRPEWTPGVEIMAAQDSFEPWHVYHERYAVCGVKTGATGIRYRGRVEPVTDLSVSFFEPGETHRNTKVHKRSEFKVLFLKPEVLEQASVELGGRRAPHFDLYPAAQAPLLAAMYALCESIERGAELLEQQSRLASCIRLFLANAEEPVSSPARVECSAILHAKRYLIDRFNHSVTLDELAATSGVSKFHLVRAFTRYWGMAPHAFQVHVRIERARALLCKGLLPVEAAMVVGFADQSHLTRHFKRIWGITPGAYARMNRRAT
jgi:AraC-like DNA-binding protein